MSATEVLEGELGIDDPRASKADRPARRTGRLDRKTWIAIGFAAPIIIYLIVFYAAPLVQNIMMSVHRYDRASFVSGHAPFVGLDIYGEILSESKFWRVLGQTAIFTIVSITFQYVIGLALAVFFQKSFPLSSTLRALFLIPWLLPVIVSGTTWQWIMNPDAGILNQFLRIFGIDPVWWLNASNSLWSVIIANVWLGIPFNLVILYAGLQNISADLYEAAALDGAGEWRKFWNITFPLLRPVTLITLLLGIVYTLKVVDIIWIMTMGTGTSETLATWSYGMAFGKGTSALIKYSEASVVGTILLVIALIFGFLYIAASRKQED